MERLPSCEDYAAKERIAYMDTWPADDSGSVPYSMGHVLRGRANGFDSSNDIVLLLLEVACFWINPRLCERVSAIKYTGSCYMKAGPCSVKDHNKIMDMSK